MPRQPNLSPAPLPGWLHSRWVPAVGTGLAVLVLACAAGLLALERRDERRDAWAQAELYARVMEDHANRTFNAAELALNAVADNLGLQLAHDEGALQSALLQQSLHSLPYLRSLSLVSSQGRILASTTAQNVGVTIDRQRLRQPGSSAKLGPMLPVRDLADLAQAPVARSIQLLPLVQALVVPQQAQGVLADAWLVAAINPDYLANQYQLILDKAKLKAAMLSYNGMLIAGSDQLRLEPGAMVAGHPLFAQLLPGHEHDRHEGAGLDGEPSLAVYRTARLHPAVLVVEVPLAAMDADFADHAQRVALGTAAALALLLGLCMLAWRSLRSHESAQRDLSAARNNMAAQDAFTDRLFQLSPIPMVVKDTSGAFVRVNQAWCRFTGFSPEQAFGRRMGQLYPGPLAAPHEVHEQLAIATRQPAAYEEQMLDGQGLPRDVMVRITPFSQADGQVAGVIGCLMDVSEFREAEARTLEAKAAAERANAAKSEFLANISHELRTPLQTIIGFSELGSLRTRTDSRVQGMFGDIHSAGQRMLTLVNDLLDLSRLESTVAEVQRAPADLASLLAQVCQELQPLAQQRKLVFRLVAPPGGLGAEVDALRIQQVMRNVLANAIRLSPEGAEILIGCQHGMAGERQITVRDRGPGIPPDELDSIFEAFVQSSRTKSGAGGTGLGLAICRKIMQAHGGRIMAANAPGGGALFTVTLPATLPGHGGPVNQAEAAGLAAGAAVSTN